MRTEAVKMHADLMSGGGEVHVDFGNGEKANWINLKRCLLMMPANNGAEQNGEEDWA
jgi:hypothetical protein